MNVLKLIKQNLCYIGKIWEKCMAVFISILTALFIFCTWEDMGVTQTFDKIKILMILCFIALVWALLWACWLKREKEVWSRGLGKIVIRYGDLCKKAFCKRNKTERLFVIPVNTCFDTIVDEDIAAYNRPLVKPGSLHGQWIKGMEKAGKSKEMLNDAIKQNLEGRGITPSNIISPDVKPRGNTKEYDIGTIAVVKGDHHSTFLLLALSRFDENNNAHATQEDLIECMKKLIDFYDGNGQGYELFIPLMGTGSSRINISHKDSLRIITSMLHLNCNQIQGKANVIIYKGDKDKVTLND